MAGNDRVCDRVRFAPTHDAGALCPSQVEIKRKGITPQQGLKLLRTATDTDEPLTEVGFTQAEALGQYWAPL